MPKQTQLQYFGFAKETTWGTGVAPTKYVPINSVKPEDTIDTVKDEGKRGAMSKVYATYPTTKKSSLDVDMDFYTNELGLFLLSVLGKVTTTGASAPYTHKFQEDKAQVSLSTNHFNGYDERQRTGMVVDEVTIKGDAEGVLTASVKMQGKYGTAVTATTPSFTGNAAAIVGAFCSCTIDSVANTNLFGFELSIKRTNKLIFGANTTQDPTKVVMGDIAVSFKLTFDVEDASEMTKFEAQTSHTIVLNLGNGAQNKAIVTLSSAWIDKASFDMGGDNLRVDWEGIGQWNSTDAGQIAFQLINSTTSY